MQKYTKAELFESVPVPRALAAMGIPTIISQLINLIYNMVDAFFIGRTGNSYMMAATTVTLTLTMMNVAFSNLFGVGGGSLIARLMGVRREEDAKRVSAYSLRGCLLLSVSWSVVIGSAPAILSLTLAHLLRNTGYSSQASFGLSLGGVLNIALDPLFMFVLLPRGQEVIGAALATLISNVVGCGYLLFAFVKAQKKAPLSLNLRLARGLDRGHVRSLYTVGVPSAMLTGLFDLASISVNILSAAHNDLVLAAMGIVMKVERVPNAINVGLCQGMLPIVAYNYSSGNHARMKQTIRTARLYGMVVSAVAIVLLEIFAKPVTNLFLSTSGKDAADAIRTVGFAALFLRIRAAASPFQFTNYHTSFCMQAIGDGKATLLHAAVRELVFYIPIMILLDRIFGENGLAAALPVGECLGAIFALWLLHRILNRKRESGPAERA